VIAGVCGVLGIWLLHARPSFWGLTLGGLVTGVGVKAKTPQRTQHGPGFVDSLGHGAPSLILFDQRPPKKPPAPLHTFMDDIYIDALLAQNSDSPVGLAFRLAEIVETLKGDGQNSVAHDPAVRATPRRRHPASVASSGCWNGI
jgi:hypothetical protein